MGKENLEKQHENDMPKTEFEIIIDREFEGRKIDLENLDERGLLSTDVGQSLLHNFQVPLVSLQDKIKLLEKTMEYLKDILSPGGEKKEEDMALHTILQKEIDIHEMKSKKFGLFSESLKTWLQKFMLHTNIATWGDLLCLNYEKIKQQVYLGGQPIGRQTFANLKKIVNEKTGFELDKNNYQDKDILYYQYSKYKSSERK